MSVNNDFKSSVKRCASAAALVAVAASSGPAFAGGLLIYEVGTADIGLASAGYNARAQDASTVFTNPAGMTRLAGNQALAGGQILWSNTSFSIDRNRTSPGLGGDSGGYAFGSDGLFLGGGGFASFTVSPDVKAGVALAGNFGAALAYDQGWVGRYYVQRTTILGVSILPTVAWKVNDKLSLGAALNAMDGYYADRVAINNLDPRFGDGELRLSDWAWGFGGNVGLLYEIDPRVRLGLTWNSQVNLNFNPSAQFQGLAPGINAALDRAGLLNSNIKIGIKVPQQLMGSIFAQVDDHWALLGSVGWQQWSRFGLIDVGVDDTTNPRSLTVALPFKDTWHVAGGAQYRLSDPWLLNFGVAYDSGFQNSSNVSPLLPVNSAWRFGIGAQQQLSKTSFWGFAAEYMYGGSLDVNVTGSKPVALGGRGDLVGSYNNTGTVFFGAYYNWAF